MPRRPIMSENEPQKLGAKPWTTMYTVTVKVVRDIDTLRLYSLVNQNALGHDSCFEVFLPLI